MSDHGIRNERVRLDAEQFTLDLDADSWAEFHALVTRPGNLIRGRYISITGSDEMRPSTAPPLIPTKPPA